MTRSGIVFFIILILNALIAAGYLIWYLIWYLVSGLVFFSLVLLI